MAKCNLNSDRHIVGLKLKSGEGLFRANHLGKMIPDSKK